jgi:hypothetical protein
MEWNSEWLRLQEWFRTEFRELPYIFVTQNGIRSIFLFRGMVWNGIPRVCFIFVTQTEFRAFFSSAEWFGMEFREFAYTFLPLYIIPSIFLFHGMVRIRIPRVFCSAEQPEFPENKPIVLSIPPNSFVGNCSSSSGSELGPPPPFHQAPPPSPVNV